MSMLSIQVCSSLVKASHSLKKENHDIYFIFIHVNIFFELYLQKYLYVFKYIHIYMCVCVCMSLCAYRFMTNLYHTSFYKNPRPLRHTPTYSPPSQVLVMVLVRPITKLFTENLIPFFQRLWNSHGRVCLGEGKHRAWDL